MLNKIETEFSIDDFGNQVILYFSSESCKPCSILTPRLEELSKEDKYDSIEFIQIPVESNKKMFKKFSLNSYPTLFFVKNGKKITQMNGISDMSNNAENDLKRIKRLIKGLYGIK